MTTPDASPARPAVTADQLAAALDITPDDTRFQLTDGHGVRYTGAQYEQVLAGLARPDITPGLPGRVRLLVRALSDSLSTGSIEPPTQSRSRRAHRASCAHWWPTSTPS